MSVRAQAGAFGGARGRRAPRSPWRTRGGLLAALVLVVGVGSGALSAPAEASPGPLVARTLAELQLGRGTRRKKGKKPRPAPTPGPAPTAAPVAPARADAEGEEGRALQRGERVEFDARLIQGQTAKAGAVYLFERVSSNLRSMVRERTSFRDEIVRPVFPTERGEP